MGLGGLAGHHVDGGQGARHGRDRLHGGADAQQLAGGEPALGAAGPAGGALDAVLGGQDLVVRLGAGHPGEVEAVADLDALDGLDAHERAGEAGVEPAVPVHVRAEPDGHAVRQHLDDAAEGVAVLVGLVDLGDHRLARVGVEAAHRVGVEPLHVGGDGVDPVRRLGGGQLHDVADDLDARGLLEVGPGDGTEGHAGCGLPGTRALQDRPGLVEAVLLHAGEVGVAGPGPGQRGVTGLLGQHLGVDRVRRHDLLPLGPLGVAHHHGDRGAHGEAVPDTAEEGDLVLLELHPRTAAVTEPSPGERVRHHLRGDRDAGGKALQRRHQCGAVRLPRGQPTQPAQRCSSCSRLKIQRRDRVRGPGPPPRSSHGRAPRPAAGPADGRRAGRMDRRDANTPRAVHL